MLIKKIQRREKRIIVGREKDERKYKRAKEGNNRWNMGRGRRERETKITNIKQNVNIQPESVEMFYFIAFCQQIVWKFQNGCISLACVVIVCNSVSASRCGAEWHVGGIDFKQCSDTWWDHHKKQHSCWGLCSSWRHGQGSVRSTLWLDG